MDAASVGKRIVEEEQKGENRAKYGQALIKDLSIELNAEFGKGFSVANLKNFRQFYLTLVEDEKGYTLCSQLSWSHIRLIMRLDAPQARTYYWSLAKDFPLLTGSFASAPKPTISILTSFFITTKEDHVHPKWHENG